MDNTPDQLTIQEKEVGMRSAGQRRINMVWEYTQAAIAFGVVTTGLYVASRLALLALSREPTATGIAAGAFVFLTSSFSLVVGFYFGRTNHARPPYPNRGD